MSVFPSETSKHLAKREGRGVGCLRSSHRGYFMSSILVSLAVGILTSVM
jgi:hypothetical protein